MTFILQPKPTFKSEVSIPVPGGKEGTIKFEFKHKGRKELRVFIESLGKEDAQRDDAEALMDIVAGWEGVDEKFSKEALETLVDAYPGAASAIFTAYHRALLEGRAKN